MRGVKMMAVPAHPLPHGALEGRIGPAANAVFHVRRDVRRVDGAERCVETAPAGKSQTIANRTIRADMADIAGTGRSHQPAALDRDAAINIRIGAFDRVDRRPPG